MESWLDRCKSLELLCKKTINLKKKLTFLALTHHMPCNRIGNQCDTLEILLLNFENAIVCACDNSNKVSETIFLICDLVPSTLAPFFFFEQFFLLYWTQGISLIVLWRQTKIQRDVSKIHSLYNCRNILRLPENFEKTCCTFTSLLI